MSTDLLARLSAWDGLGVVSRYDAATDSWIFIALHDDALGRPTGGTRMASYPTPADALVDAQRLAAGMTRKWAAVGFGFGGGKAVLAVPEGLSGEKRQGLLRRYGQLLTSLSGSFATGPDLGTTPGDMQLLARSTRWVHGVDHATGAARDPGIFTARGVFAAIGAAVEQRFGSRELTGRTVLVQGVGAVGRPLLHHLAAAGARLAISDTDPDRLTPIATDLGADIVAPEAVFDAPCDVFAPCAVGGILNRQTIPRLACAVVAGSANNQLATDDDAMRLHRRSILYAPDYIVNGGGAVGFALLSEGADEATALERIDAIGGRLAALFREAAAGNESPHVVAERQVNETLVLARRRPRNGQHPDD